MGIGARVSREINDKYLLTSLIITEMCLSLVVSFSVYLSYLQAPDSDRLSVFIYSMCFLIGLLIGMEIPLAVRINESFEELRDNISSILEKDYLGALPGGILYGYFFLPKLGLLYTPVIVGTLNLLVAALLFLGFSTRISKKFYFLYGLVFSLIICFSIFARPLYLYAEQRFYRDPIVAIKQTKYQKIVLTRWKNDYLLYLDGHLQLSTVDEYRYHETIVHIPMSLTNARHILVIGGGDGCVLRELEKYPGVEDIVLVDMDKEFVQFAMQNPIMRRINKDSFRDKRVNIYFEDGFKFVKDISTKGKRSFDLIIIDLTDPRNLKSSRLYTKEFYEVLYNILNPHGAIITQASSPFFAKKAFCCILNSVSSAHFFSYPMDMNVPSFGEWGFVLGMKQRLDKNQLKARIFYNFNEQYTRYLTREKAISVFDMGKNFSCKGILPNTLINPVILHYYNDSMWELM